MSEENAGAAGGERASADWAGVGESFRLLGRRLSEHAKGAGSAISTATGQAEGAVDQVGSAFKTAVDHLDATTTDPEVKAATRTATARLLDAIKAELTGEPRSDDPPPEGQPPQVTSS